MSRKPEKPISPAMSDEEIVDRLSACNLAIPRMSLLSELARPLLIFLLLVALFLFGSRLAAQFVSWRGEFLLSLFGAAVGKE